MGEFMLRGLNKIDRPHTLLIWCEDDGTMTVRKITEEGFIFVDLREELKEISKLEEEKQKEEQSKLPSKIERAIAENLDIKGSLPYEIRDWVSGFIADQTIREKRTDHSDK